jgi:hypothetical protein
MPDRRVVGGCPAPDPPISRTHAVAVSFSALGPLCPTVGIIGFGAFGRLMARQRAPHRDLRACDPPASGSAVPSAASRA